MKKLTLTQLNSLKSGKTLNTRVIAMQAIKIDKGNIKEILDSSDGDGVEDLKLSSKAILMRSVNGNYEESLAMADWSSKAKPGSRKAIVGSFIGNKQGLLLVHSISQLQKQDATVLMKDYFAEGGSDNDIWEWLAAAGQILKTGVIPDDKDGFFSSIGSAIGGAVGGLVDAVVGAINTVADAIAAAGKNLVNAIKEVAKWTQSKIDDFVEAILRAGKTIAQVLNEAAKQGLTKLKNFVKAVYNAGRKIADVLVWAITQPEDTLIALLNYAETLVGSFTTLLFDIARLSVVNLAKAIKALLKAGKKVIDFVLRLERLAYAAAKQIIIELKKAGQTVAALIGAIINQSRIVARIVIDGLISLGTAIVTIFQELASKTVQAISIIIGALKDLGIQLAAILTEIAKLTAAIAKNIMKGLMLIFQNLFEILEEIGKKVASVMNTLLTALLGTLIHFADVVKSILIDVRAAFRLGLIRGLIQIGKSVLILMKEALLISASAAAVMFAIIMDVFGSHRGLTKDEMFEARKVFGFSIDLGAVKISSASYPADLITWLNGNRAFTTMYVININSGTQLTTSTLIHELTHVWQAENSGGVYMLEALHSQIAGRAYNLTLTDIQNARGNILKLEREQQAVLVQEYWKAKFDGQNTKIPLAVLEPLALQVFTGPAPLRVLRPANIRLVTARVGG